MDSQWNRGHRRQERLEDEQFYLVIAQIVAFADGLDQLGQELGLVAAGGVGLAAEVAMGDQLLDAIDGGIGDLENAGIGGVDERAEDGLGIGERVLGCAAVVEWAWAG